jgi:geranylgeranyl transferase type-1 subunit beta
MPQLNTPQVLDHFHIIDQTAMRRYLLDKTQHIVGGFGKIPGDPPDPYHSYLGLATLALIGEPGVKSFYAPLCFSIDAKNRLESLGWRKTIIETWDSERLKS